MASERLDRELRHVLRRCPKLSDAQMRFLAFVASYSQGCLLTYEEICKLTSWSRSKLIRTIRSLESYGLIEIKYRPYKRTAIKIAPAWRQSEFAKAFDVSSVTQEPCVTQETVMDHPRYHDVPPMTQPILEKELERKLETSNSDDDGLGKVNVQALIADVFPDLGRKILRTCL